MSFLLDYLQSIASAVSGAAIQTNLAADLVPAIGGSIEVTLSATPGTVTSIAIPVGSRIIEIFPRSNHVRYAINEDPEAVGTSSSTSIATTAIKKGKVAKADSWSTRIISAATSTDTLRIRSITASVVVDVVFS